MAKFLTIDEVYSLIQRELPEDVYPLGAADAYWSTADSYTTAGSISDLYSNLERIYLNNYPQSAEERLSDWEFAFFGYIADAILTIEERQDLLLQRIRTRYSMNPADLILIVKSIIGPDKIVEIREWVSESGTWILDESELEIDTILGGSLAFRVWGPTLCDDDPAEWGLTQDQWDEIREDAYTYDVRIYSYTLTAIERARIDTELSKAELGGAQHIIIDNCDPDDLLEAET